jgi:hypothetical protein
MHKRVERILIGLAILVAAIYALISFWPVDRPTSAPPKTSYMTPKEQPADSSQGFAKAEAEVIANLIKIGSAEMSFRTLKKRFGTMQELVRENLLSGKYSDGVIITGYQYSLGVNSEHFALYADPVPGSGRHYFIDETLDPRYDNNGRASSSSLYLSYSKNQSPTGIPIGLEGPPLPTSPK